MKRVYFLLMMAIVISLIGTACGGATATPPPTAPTAVVAATKAPVAAGVKALRIGRATYPDVLDPQKSSYGIEIEFLKLAYEGLLAIDEKGNIGPGSADTWKSSADGTQMSFHIRAGLKRFDGTPITAKDFEYALKREVDPNVPGKQYTSILYDIKGAEALDNFDPKKGTKADLDKLWADYGVKATDDSNLVVTFKNPIGFWQYVAYTWVTYPSDQKIVDKDPDNWWTKAAGHNGNGPFKVQSMEQGKKIVFVPNDSYWRGKPKLNRIELIYNPDNAVIFQAYGKDELDIDANMIAEEMAVVQADAKLKADFLRFPSAVTTGFAFNITKKPFDDLNVRKAFSAAFDRVGFIRDVVKGLGGAYTRWVPPGVPGAQDTKPGVPGFDAKVAVNYLVANGYAASTSTADKPKVDCDKLGAIKLTYGASPINHSRNQFIAGSFAAVFGCPITLDPVDPTVMTALAKDIKTQPQISRQGWIQDYPHPQNWLSVYWVCNAFAARYGYCDKNFDAATAKADQELDFQKSLALYGAAEDLLVQGVPSAFAYFNQQIYMVKPWVIGPKDHTGSSDAEWAGEWGPVWTYDIDLTKVPANYPKQ